MYRQTRLETLCRGLEFSVFAPAGPSCQALNPLLDVLMSPCYYPQRSAFAHIELMVESTLPNGPVAISGYELTTVCPLPHSLEIVAELELLAAPSQDIQRRVLSAKQTLRAKCAKSLLSRVSVDSKYKEKFEIAWHHLVVAQDAN